MLIIHLVTRLLRAGSEENTIATACWQANAGYDVVVVSGKGADPYWQETFGEQLRFVEMSSLTHPIDPVNDVRALLALRRLFADLQPTVIHTHQSKAGIVGRLAASVVPGARVVHGIHIVPFEGVHPLLAKAYIWLEKLAAKNTDTFIAVSKAVGKVYSDVGISERVETVYSGMDLEQFRAAKIPKDFNQLLALNSKHSTRPPVVLMLASLEPRKRHVDFLSVFTDVVKAIPNIRLLLAGEGPMADELKQLVESLDLQSNVVFCGFRNDPHALIAGADLCVLTSEREGLARVVVQSIASGKPIVATQLPGLDEIINHEKNGIICDVSDMQGIATTIIRLLTNRRTLQDLTNGARETDVSAWELDTLGRRTTELYAL